MLKIVAPAAIASASATQPSDHFAKLTLRRGAIIRMGQYRAKASTNAGRAQATWIGMKGRSRAGTQKPIAAAEAISWTTPTKVANLT